VVIDDLDGRRNLKATCVCVCVEGVRRLRWLRAAESNDSTVQLLHLLQEAEIVRSGEKRKMTQSRSSIRTGTVRR
jgi:hypothetical protein